MFDPPFANLDTEGIKDMLDMDLGCGSAVPWDCRPTTDRHERRAMRQPAAVRTNASSYQPVDLNMLPPSPTSRMSDRARNEASGALAIELT